MTRLKMAVLALLLLSDKGDLHDSDCDTLPLYDQITFPCNCGVPSALRELSDAVERSA